MDLPSLAAALSDIPLGAIRYYPVIGSTNDEALRWAEQSAPDLALVVADEQTSGKGRAGRRWITPAGSALAFSLVVYPQPGETAALSRMTALGALAVCSALQDLYGIVSQIKWPNDVIIKRRKVAGILTELSWKGSQLSSVIVGIGINALRSSVDESVLHSSSQLFPVTSVESELGSPVDRFQLLTAVLKWLLDWRPRLAAPAFLQAWEAALAFRSEWVQVFTDGSSGDEGAPVCEGQLQGLDEDGSLTLLDRSGGSLHVQVGDIRLRPVH